MSDVDGDLSWPVVDLGLWGKERNLGGRFYPLVCHSLDASAMAGVLWDEYLTGGQRAAVARGLGVQPEWCRQLMVFWAGLHDVGKAVSCFQRGVASAVTGLAHYPASMVDDRLRHDVAAHYWLAGALSGLGYPCGGFESRRPAVRVAQMLGGHHGRFHPIDVGAMSAPSLVAPLGGGLWQEQREALMSVVWQVAGRPGPPARVDAATASLVCGVVILADWLVSQESYLSARLADLPADSSRQALEDHFTASTAGTPGLLRDAGLAPLRLRSGTFGEEFPDIRKPFGLQESVANDLPGVLAGPGVLVVMAPTGEGKTETALHAARLMAAASGASGVVVALPTMATADQMFGRVGRYAARRSAGSASQTLLHGMAAFNPDYGPAIEDDRRSEVVTGEDCDDNQVVRIAPVDWLRARKRGILARLTVCTIDQVLAAMLPVRHNQVRLLGLTGKVLIIDEAHAYDTYMQGLLRRLLRWLGHFGVPVVLLSATLPTQTARRLVDAYLDRTDTADITVDGGLQLDYPSWAFADLASGKVTTRRVSTRTRTLAVSTHPVAVTADGAADRGDVLRRLLAPVFGGGCALVVCTTVAEAQATYAALRDWFATTPGAPELSLLHARFPAAKRRAITTKVMEAFGRDGGKRPRAAVLVATQIVEQSLDLDFDLVVSDLAPIALLLQRAGRCWRHDRPAQVRGGFGGPELAVVVPTGNDGGLRLPFGWTAVYDRSLMERTLRLLTDIPAKVVIPDDVQRLVDAVYDVTFADGVTDADTARIAEEEVREQLARMVAIPPPSNLSDLHDLSKSEVDEELIATRLGADSVRTLPCYLDPTGQRFLDRACTRPLPLRGTHKGRFTSDEVRDLLDATIPVRAGGWSRQGGPQTDVPDRWRDNPWLRDLVLIPQPVTGEADVLPAAIGGRLLFLDATLGLVITRVS